jgi:hypothetical protein
MSLRYVTHHLMVMHPHTKYHWPISKDKNVMAQTRKYYLKNNYLTLRSKVKVPRRSLRYATHCLKLWSSTHIPNKYYLKNNYLILKSKSHEGHYGTWHTVLWSCTHIPNIIDLSRKTKILFKKQLFDLEVKGQGPTKVITACDTPPYGHAPTYQINTI